MYSHSPEWVAHGLVLDKLSQLQHIGALDDRDSYARLHRSSHIETLAHIGSKPGPWLLELLWRQCVQVSTPDSWRYYRLLIVLLQPAFGRSAQIRLENGDPHNSGEVWQLITKDSCGRTLFSTRQVLRNVLVAEKLCATAVGMDDEKSWCMLLKNSDLAIHSKLVFAAHVRDIISVCRNHAEVTVISHIEYIPVAIHSLDSNVSVVAEHVANLPLRQQLLHVFHGSWEVGQDTLRVNLQSTTIVVVQHVVAVREDVDGCAVTEYRQVFTGHAVKLDSSEARALYLDKLVGLDIVLLLCKMGKSKTYKFLKLKLWSTAALCRYKRISYTVHKGFKILESIQKADFFSVKSVSDFNWQL